MNVAQCMHLTELSRSHYKTWSIAGLKILGLVTVVSVQVRSGAPFLSNYIQLYGSSHCYLEISGQRTSVFGLQFDHNIPINLLCVGAIRKCLRFEMRSNRVPSEFNLNAFMVAILKKSQMFQVCKYLKTLERKVEQNRVLQLSCTVPNFDLTSRRKV